MQRSQAFVLAHHLPIALLRRVDTLDQKKMQKQVQSEQPKTLVFDPREIATKQTHFVDVEGMLIRRADAGRLMRPVNIDDRVVSQRVPGHQHPPGLSTSWIAQGDSGVHVMEDIARVDHIERFWG